MSMPISPASATAIVNAISIAAAECATVPAAKTASNVTVMKWRIRTMVLDYCILVGASICTTPGLRSLTCT